MGMCCEKKTLIGWMHNESLCIPCVFSSWIEWFQSRKSLLQRTSVQQNCVYKVRRLLLQHIIMTYCDMWLNQYHVLCSVHHTVLCVVFSVLSALISKLLSHPFLLLSFYIGLTLLIYTSQNCTLHNFGSRVITAAASQWLADGSLLADPAKATLRRRCWHCSTVNMGVRLSWNGALARWNWQSSRNRQTHCCPQRDFSKVRTDLSTEFGWNTILIDRIRIE